MALNAPNLDSIRIFVQVVARGSISAAARDRRVSPAVASNRLKELEAALGVRLFNRTTRRVVPTEMGRLYHDHALRILAAVDAAEAALSDHSETLRGTVHVATPLGLGRRVIAPLAAEFQAGHPDVELRLRMTDHVPDLLDEGVDLAFHLGPAEDSTLTRRFIRDCPRVLAAAPDYLARAGVPEVPQDLRDHACLLLRYPGTPEHSWHFEAPGGTERLPLSGPLSADDGDVLLDWALAGRGIVNRPLFELAPHLRSGALVRVGVGLEPVPAPLAILYPHRDLVDPKVRAFINWAATRVGPALDQEPR